MTVTVCHFMYTDSRNTMRMFFMGFEQGFYKVFAVYTVIIYGDNYIVGK